MTRTPEAAREAPTTEWALAYLLRTTQRRPQTEAELAARLHARGVPEESVAAALARAKRIGAVDDGAFARAWVEDRGRMRGYGRARLRRELAQRLVPEVLVDEALLALDERDDEAVAAELARDRAQRLAPSLPPETVARRLQAWLVRRGYPPSLAQRVARAVSGLDRAWD
jgi:regulatory protein